jgi:hypothetical protein
MARIVGGRVSSVRIFQLPPDGEMLAVDGSQVWYGSSDGLGSVAATEIGHLFTSASFGSSEDEPDDSPADR